MAYEKPTQKEVLEAKRIIALDLLSRLTESATAQKVAQEAQIAKLDAQIAKLEE